ncbi:MAG: DUF1465 family protein [Emcibacteraceae bacterium]|nr:DUF1465 family protein [Emcibacteraceae bacterium]
MFKDFIMDDGTLRSKLLDELYHEALDLSRSIAEYFQCNKIGNIKSVPSDLMSFYSLECNRMTAGVMQAMSWCLMQKGVRSGEITYEEAAEKHSRLTDNDLFDNQIGCETEAFPKDFVIYSERARVLYDRIVRLDRILYDTPTAKGNPVHGLMDKIEKI